VSAAVVERRQPVKAVFGTPLKARRLNVKQSDLEGLYANFFLWG
jgi:hypothetical protein